MVYSLNCKLEQIIVVILALETEAAAGIATSKKKYHLSISDCKLFEELIKLYGNDYKVNF